MASPYLCSSYPIIGNKPQDVLYVARITAPHSVSQTLSSQFLRPFVFKISNPGNPVWLRGEWDEKLFLPLAGSKHTLSLDLHSPSDNPFYSLAISLVSSNSFDFVTADGNVLISEYHPFADRHITVFNSTPQPQHSSSSSIISDPSLPLIYSRGPPPENSTLQMEILHPKLVLPALYYQSYYTWTLSSLKTHLQLLHHELSHGDVIRFRLLSGSAHTPFFNHFLPLRILQTGPQTVIPIPAYHLIRYTPDRFPLQRFTKQTPSVLRRIIWEQPNTIEQAFSVYVSGDWFQSEELRETWLPLLPQTAATSIGTMEGFPVYPPGTKWTINLENPLGWFHHFDGVLEPRKQYTFKFCINLRLFTTSNRYVVLLPGNPPCNSATTEEIQ